MVTMLAKNYIDVINATLCHYNDISCTVFGTLEFAISVFEEFGMRRCWRYSTIHKSRSKERFISVLGFMLVVRMNGYS